MAAAVRLLESDKLDEAGINRLNYVRARLDDFEKRGPGNMQN